MKRLTLATVLIAVVSACGAETPTTPDAGGDRPATTSDVLDAADGAVSADTPDVADAPGAIDVTDVVVADASEGAVDALPDDRAVVVDDVLDTPPVDAPSADTIVEADTTVDAGERCSPGSTRPCYSGPPLTRGVGRCVSGTQICGTGGVYDVACLAEVTPATSETCSNMADDDCDGMVDEGCTECMPGATRPCYSGAGSTRDVGRCRAGTQVCGTTGVYGTSCIGEQLPAMSETCGNVMDDDCNGAVDDACGECSPGATRSCYTGPPGTRDVGRCRGGTQNCGTDRRWGTTCAGETLPGTEACNGIDDNCAGGVDDDPTRTLCALPRATASMCTDGACAVTTCNSGTGDCDGVVTNGCEADLSTVAHCGACGRSCAPGQTCTAGTCTSPPSVGTPIVALGETFGCAIIAGGRVVCWGSNALGQLGSDTTNTFGPTTPGYVSSIGGATAIDLGPHHACAVFGGGGLVSCWGANDARQLGDGTVINRSVPTPVTGLTGVTQVALGGSHGCALRRAGIIACWGANGSGQLGDGTRTGRGVAGDIPGLSGATQVVAGDHHACALLGDATVRCWGSNARGQLGDSTITDRLVPTAVMGLSGVIHLAAGASHTCAVLSAGAVRCWGSNDFGQLGDGTLGVRSVPTAVMAVSSAVQIEAGANHTCARRADGMVVCWGQNANGQVGDGSRALQLTPVVVAGVTGAARLAVGREQACATTSTETRCWGFNNYGQLGDSSRTDRLVPSVPIFGLHGSRACSGAACNMPVSASVGSGTTACTTRPGGDVVCWGSAVVVGGAYSRRYGPTTDALTDARSVHFGSGSQLCAVLTSGAVRCRGPNGNGELGNGTTTTSLAPVSVVGITDGEEVGGGNGFTCARRRSGLVSCWGDNSGGQLGDGTSTSRSTPNVVGGTSPIGDASSLAVGVNFVCVLRAGGTVWCWGTNSSGQLGDGGSTTQRLPVQVRGTGGGFLTGVTQLSAGGEHVCAVRSGAIVCWGRNVSGQLGDNTTTNRSTPVQVAGVFDAIAVSAGGSHSCAIRSASTVVCWGGNNNGALGDGTRTASQTPVRVTGLIDIVSVAAGNAYTCARRSDGAVFCWGIGSNGELGDGNTFDRMTPQGPIFGLP